MPTYDPRSSYDPNFNPYSTQNSVYGGAVTNGLAGSQTPSSQLNAQTQPSPSPTPSFGSGAGGVGSGGKSDPVASFGQAAQQWIQYLTPMIQSAGTAGTERGRAVGHQPTFPGHQIPNPGLPYTPDPGGSLPPPSPSPPSPQFQTFDAQQTGPVPFTPPSTTPTTPLPSPPPPPSLDRRHAVNPPIATPGNMNTGNDQFDANGNAYGPNYPPPKPPNTEDPEVAASWYRKFQYLDPAYANISGATVTAYRTSGYQGSIGDWLKNGAPTPAQTPPPPPSQWTDPWNPNEPTRGGIPGVGSPFLPMTPDRVGTPGTGGTGGMFPLEPTRGGVPSTGPSGLPYDPSTLRGDGSTTTNPFIPYPSSSFSSSPLTFTAASTILNDGSDRGILPESPLVPPPEPPSVPPPAVPPPSTTPPPATTPPPTTSYGYNNPPPKPPNTENPEVAADWYRKFAYIDPSYATITAADVSSYRTSGYPGNFEAWWKAGKPTPAQTSPPDPRDDSSSPIGGGLPGGLPGGGTSPKVDRDGNPIRPPGSDDSSLLELSKYLRGLSGPLWEQQQEDYMRGLNTNAANSGSINSGAFGMAQSRGLADLINAQQSGLVGNIFTGSESMKDRANREAIARLGADAQIQSAGIGASASSASANASAQMQKYIADLQNQQFYANLPYQDKWHGYDFQLGQDKINADFWQYLAGLMGGLTFPPTSGIPQLPTGGFF